MFHGASVRPFLQSQLGWPVLAVGGCLSSGHLGIGGEWHVLCRHVHPYPEPRADVALTAAADLNSRRGGHGHGHHRRVDGGIFTHESDKILSGVLRGLYDRLFSPLRNGVERGMKSPVFYVLL